MAMGSGGMLGSGMTGGGLLGKLSARSGMSSVASTGEYVAIDSGAGDCQDGSCGVGGSGETVQTGGLLGGLFARRATNAVYETAPSASAGGCGVAGCGAGGSLCSSCSGLGQGGPGHGGPGQGGLGQGGLRHGGLGHGGLFGRFKGKAEAEHPYGGMSPMTPPMAGPHGPMAPSYGYPYYTTRGPRDFLMANPPSLGR